MKKIYSNHKRAFTLIELLVTISIIGILATLITVNLLRAQAKGRDTRRKSDVSMIMSAIVMYGADHGGVLPGADGAIETTTNGTASTLDTTIRAGGYIEKMPVDPKGTNVSASTAANYTGYQYFDGSYINKNPGSGVCSAVTDYTTRKGFVYASLENPTADDSATMTTNLDICIATKLNYTSTEGTNLNFRLSN